MKCHLKGSLNDLLQMKDVWQEQGRLMQKCRAVLKEQSEQHYSNLLSCRGMADFQQTLGEELNVLQDIFTSLMQHLEEERLASSAAEKQRRVSCSFC
jgi:hypothetical protein